MTKHLHWWQKTSYYHISPCSFMDSIRAGHRASKEMKAITIV